MDLVLIDRLLFRNGLNSTKKMGRTRNNEDKQGKVPRPSLDTWIWVLMDLMFTYVSHSRVLFFFLLILVSAFIFFFFLVYLGNDSLSILPL